MKLTSRGVSLLEILISLLLLSIILLSFGASEVVTIRDSREAYYFATAANQLYAMKERWRVFQGRNELQQQIALWNLQNQEVLPQGKGNVTSQQIKINWDDNRWLEESIHYSVSR